MPARLSDGYEMLTPRVDKTVVIRETVVTLQTIFFVSSYSRLTLPEVQKKGGGAVGGNTRR